MDVTSILEKTGLVLKSLTKNYISPKSVMGGQPFWQRNRKTQISLTQIIHVINDTAAGQWIQAQFQVRC
uniref:Uncharacterized protein n=1 Tax=Anguilla anguilla TaxID=7936 RepID=A0A0E9UA95_ANGAN